MPQKESTKLAELYDLALLDLVKHGRILITPDGMPLKDETTGKEIRQPMTAVDLNVIRARLKDCGQTRILGQGGTLDVVEEELEGNTPSEEEIKEHVLKLSEEFGIPPVSQESDAASA